MVNIVGTDKLEQKRKRIAREKVFKKILRKYGFWAPQKCERSSDAIIVR
jgi:hypothetical protein